MPSTTTPSEPVFLDAGIFIAAVLHGHPQNFEARPIVEAARLGRLKAFTSCSVMSEVYAALTWKGTTPARSPEDGAAAVRSFVSPPSAVQVVECGLSVLLKAMELSARHRLTARRTHDARHAASALIAGVCSVYTLDVDDWRKFELDGIKIVGPASALARLAGRASP